MDLHAKHEIDWLGLVRVLELLVCYEGHHEAWLVGWNGLDMG